MTLPATVTVEAVFIGIYALLAGATIFNVVKHGVRRKAGYVFLLLFALIRLTGNILLIVAYKQNYQAKDKGIIIAGFILQGLGYSFLISATISFLATAIRDPDADFFKDMVGIRKFNITRLLAIANIVALILLIVGFNESDSIWGDLASGTSGNSNAKLATIADVGSIIFLALTIIIILVAAHHTLMKANERTRTQKVILLFVLAASPFMLVRIAYVTYLYFQTNPFNRSWVLRTILEFVMEAIVNIIYFIMGLVISNSALRADDKFTPRIPVHGETRYYNQDESPASSQAHFAANKYGYEANRF